MARIQNDEDAQLGKGSGRAGCCDGSDTPVIAQRLRTCAGAAFSFPAGRDCAVRVLKAGPLAVALPARFGATAFVRCVCCLLTERK